MAGKRAEMTGLLLFDAAFYLAQAEGLPDIGTDPLRHYREAGWRLLLDPHPMFGTARYLRQAGPDDEAAAGALDPVQRYLRQGAAADVSVSRWFDAAAYRGANPDVAAAGVDPLVHFVGHGAAEERSAGPRMDAFLRRHPAYRRPGGALDVARDDHASYDAWLRTSRHVPPVVRDAARAAVRAAMGGEPLVSVLLHVDDAESFPGVLATLRAQVHEAWELCVAAPSDAVAGLQAAAAGEPRVRVLPMQDDGAEAATVLADARGEWAWMMGVSDRLHPLAFSTLLAGCADADAAYCDEDRILAEGEVPGGPVFRPAWSPELLLGDEALLQACLVRIGVLREAGGFEAAAHELLLRALLPLPAARVVHVAHALVHRAGPQARRRVAAPLALSGRPCVGVVITGENLTVPRPLGPEWLLGACLAGLQGETDWPLLDIVVAVPGPVAPWQDQVFAAMGARHVPGVGAAVRAVRGDMVLLLDEALTPRGPQWLRAMVAAAARPGVGVVGARLSFADGRVCHAGLTLQDGVPVRPFFGAPGDVADAAPRTLRTCLAVSGACLLMPRAAWDLVGGLDEAWPPGLSDVDLCLRAADLGLRTVYVPEATLFHARPVPPAVSAPDLQRFRERWGSTPDPYTPDALPDWEPFRAVPLDTALGTPSEAQPLPPGMYRVGVTWFGPVNRASGMGTASRGYLEVCAAAGIGVRPLPLDEVFGHQPLVPSPPPGPMRDFPITVLHVNADTMTNRHHLHAEAFVNARARIGLWVWELAAARPEWAAAAARLHEIWTPSAFCTKAFRAITDVPVATVPYMVPRRDRPDRAAARAGLQAAYGVPADAFLALYMLDTYSLVARKNPQALLDAFAAEFGTEADGRAVLVLKVSGAGHLRDSPWPEDQALLNVIRSSPPNVIVITGTLDEGAMTQLMGGADCYVSPHRSEGFGLTVAEAMALGTPVIATDWAATAEFVIPGAGLPLECSLVPLAQDRGPYGAGSLWADASVPHLRTLLRQVAGDAGLRAALGSAGQALVRYRFSAAAVGTAMQRRLEGLAARTR